MASAGGSLRVFEIIDDAIDDASEIGPGHLEPGSGFRTKRSRERVILGLYSFGFLFRLRASIVFPVERAPSPGDSARNPPRVAQERLPRFASRFSLDDRAMCARYRSKQASTARSSRRSALFATLFITRRSPSPCDRRIDGKSRFGSRIGRLLLRVGMPQPRSSDGKAEIMVEIPSKAAADIPRRVFFDGPDALDKARIEDPARSLISVLRHRAGNRAQAEDRPYRQCDSPAEEGCIARGFLSPGRGLL